MRACSDLFRSLDEAETKFCPAEPSRMGLCSTSSLHLRDSPQDRAPRAHHPRRRPPAVARSQRRRDALARLAGARALPCARSLHLHADAHHQHTNVCVAQCDYCAFYTLPGQAGGYVLSAGAGLRQDRRTARAGRRPRRLQRGLQPPSLARLLLRLVRAIRARYGDRIELYAFTIAEFIYLADHASLDYAAAAERLKAGRRPLDHRRRLGDSDRRLPPPPQQVQVHRRAVSSRRRPPSSPPACGRPPPW